jgi:hypothetical protein
VGKRLKPFGSIQPNAPASNKNAKRRTERIILILNALNILSEPALPPLRRPITAEPKNINIKTSTAITNKFISFLDYLKKRPLNRGH